MYKNIIVLAALAFAAGACSGGGSPTSPTPPAPSGPTTLTLLSFDGGPAAGVPVTVDGNRAVTDANGVATFNAALRPGAPLAIDGGLPFLKHECAYDGAPVHTHRLFPVDSPGELSREFVRWLAFGGQTNRNMMYRMTKPAAVYLSGWSPEEEMVISPAVQAGVGIARAIHDFRITAPGPNDVPVRVVREAQPSPEGYFVWTSRNVLNGEVAGADVHIVASALRGDTRLGDTIAHELGHAFGLGHNPEGGLMSPVQGSFHDFTPAERRVVEFMLSRPPGTRWEDTFPR
jgi:hypothetical protein